MIRVSLFWGCGYIGMWASKWILGSLLTDTNVLKDAGAALLKRSGTVVEGVQITRADAVLQIFSTVLKWPYVIAIAFAVFVVLWMAAKESRRAHTRIFSGWRKRLPYTLLYLLIALYPAGWVLLAANHSYYHPRLVYRIAGISLFAGIAAIQYLCGGNTKNSYHT